MATLPVWGVATLGPDLDMQHFVAPPNVAIVGAADHDRILRHAHVVVTHAGMER